MTTYVAFLRAINVGGHTVKMDELKRAFEALHFDNVSTFIASGNVIFDASADAATLEPRIEQHLREWFGYAVGTFLRSDEEVKRIAAHQPFADEGRVYLLLMRSEPDAARNAGMLALASAHEPVAVREREVYWQSPSMLESQVAGPLGKMLGAECTMRNANTLRRLAAKFEMPPHAARPSRKSSGSVSKVNP